MVTFYTKYDRHSPVLVTAESAVISPVDYTVTLHQVPATGVAVTTAGLASGGVGYTQVYVPPVAPGEFEVNYDNGRLQYFSTEAGLNVDITYFGIGSLIWAENINTLQSAIVTLDSMTATTVASGFTSNATGDPGMLKFNSSYFYVCTSADTWKRAPLYTF